MNDREWEFVSTFLKLYGFRIVCLREYRKEYSIISPKNIRNRYSKNIIS